DPDQLFIPWKLLLDILQIKPEYGFYGRFKK
ncbi:hypothetical protein CCACVL1_00580, partial [Corchorus capsularis]